MKELPKDLRDEIDAYLEKRNGQFAAQYMLEARQDIDAREKSRLDDLHKKSEIWAKISGIGLIAFLLAGAAFVQTRAINLAENSAETKINQVIAEADDLPAKVKEAEKILHNAQVAADSAKRALATAESFDARSSRLVSDTEDLKDRTERATLTVERLERLLNENGEGSLSKIIKSVLDDNSIKDKIVDAAAFPAGVVISSVRECSKLEPKGSWSNYDEAVGRTLIGAGTAIKRLSSDFTNYKLIKADGAVEYVPLKPYSDDPYDVEEVGGAEQVRLGSDEMPKHGHDIGFVTLRQQNGKLSIHGPNSLPGVHMPYFMDGSSSIQEGRTDSGIFSNGESEPHNNMPPYIALYFCKKD